MIAIVSIEPYQVEGFRLTKHLIPTGWDEHGRSAIIRASARWLIRSRQLPRELLFQVLDPPPTRSLLDGAYGS